MSEAANGHALALDLPCAHSMDTRWFAVDDQGRLATFDSGEAGAVPEAWTGGQDGGHTLMDALLATGRVDLSEEAALPASSRPWMYDDDGVLREAEGVDEHYRLLLRLAHPSVRDLIPQAHALARRFVYVSGPVPGELLAVLLDRGLVERSWSWYSLSPAHLGLYGYGHGDRWENWISGPYERESAPRLPLHLSELPLALAARAVRLPVSFADCEALQPVLLMSCRSWQREWVDLQGQHHPFED